MTKSDPSRRDATLALAAAALAGAAASPALANRPNMKKALDALEEAREHLNAATSGGAGHRQKALQHVNAAINEVKTSMGQG